jgi:hypothetical protein
LNSKQLQFQDLSALLGEVALKYSNLSCKQLNLLRQNFRGGVTVTGSHRCQNTPAVAMSFQERLMSTKVRSIHGKVGFDGDGLSFSVREVIGCALEIELLLQYASFTNLLVDEETLESFVARFDHDVA